MNNSDIDISKEINFIVVDDKPVAAQAMGIILGRRNITVLAVTGDVDYLSETRREVQNTYNDGKVPVIQLDENLGTFSGTEIMLDIVKNFPQGGLIFPGSMRPVDQVKKWSNQGLDEMNGWEVDTQLFRIMSSYKGFPYDSYEQICREFLQRRFARESKSEFKNK